MRIIQKAKRAFRGDIAPRLLFLEAARQASASFRGWRERAVLEQLETCSVGLSGQFADMSPAELLSHFQGRNSPQFLPGFRALAETGALQETLFPDATKQLVEEATRIASQHRWRLMGYGEKDFGSEQINWRRDPLSGVEWPLDYHSDVQIVRHDGSDARVLWELNRLGHLITLGRAFALTGNSQIAAEFFAQCESWRRQNPIGRGPNWACAMEVALRAMNLLAAFELFRHSPLLNEERLMALLKLFDSHGAHIRRNLEFSHIATSNHYLSDVTGLLWLGVMLPELQRAHEWRDFGLQEIQREIDKQILDDGADYEASTGYHRFVLELILYSFILCRANEIAFEEKYWRKLHGMLDYVNSYLRPDGRAPLIGDSDSGRVLPVSFRMADDHKYLVALGAALFKESRFKHPQYATPEELLWVLGRQGLDEYENLPADRAGPTSKAFPETGTYIMRDGALYLLFNASSSGVGGRGSHGHNDALSIEVSVCGTSFINDPGTFVYTADLHERHLFRSTAYHSTVEVDGEEQNVIDENIPFLIGDQARPRVLTWESTPEGDRVAAEHDGYRRLSDGVAHCRVVEFDKQRRYWRVIDGLHGEGEHRLCFNFIFAPEVEPRLRGDGIVQACDKIRGVSLLLTPLDWQQEPELAPRWVSRDYGAKLPALAACWTMHVRLPFIARWAMLPVCEDADEALLMALIEGLRQKPAGEIRFGVLPAARSSAREPGR